MTDFFTGNLLSNFQIGHVICRTLHRFGPMEESDLNLLLVPRNDKGEEAEVSNQWSKTVVVLKGIGVLNDNGEKLELSKVFENCNELSHPDFSLRFMECLVTSNMKKIESSEKPDDLFVCIAWLLTLPNGSLLSDFSIGNPSPQQSMAAFGLDSMNKERWDAFCRWAKSLGLIESLDNRTDIPEVKNLISWAIKGKTFDKTVVEFISDLSRFLPLLENQKFFNWCDAEGLKPERFKRIGEQISWALYSLSESGEIELDNRDDGSQQFTLNLSATSAISVNVIGKKS